MKDNSAHHRVVEVDTFAAHYELARNLNAQIAVNTSTTSEVTAIAGATYYLSVDCLSGFAVRADGELVGVFSRVKGRGNALVADALFVGATHLDCFDGYLVELYSRHGFYVHHRAPNWTPGGPDVVYMLHADAFGALPVKPSNPHRFVLA